MPQLYAGNATQLKRSEFLPGPQKRLRVEMPAPHRVAYCLSSSEARGIVETALRIAGFDAIPLEAGGTAISLPQLRECSGLIHDLYPWDITGTIQIEGLRHRFPDLLILLYAPARAGIAQLLSFCAHLSGVRAELQQAFTSSEAERLRNLVISMMDDGPRPRLLRMIQAVTPDAPASAWRFTELALRSMGRGRLTVGQLATGLGLSLRTLERTWHDAALPAPKELLEWLSLLFAGLLSGQSGISVASAARGLGIDTQQLYRFRQRLLPGALRSSREEFETVLLAFAGRCRTLRRPSRTLTSRSSYWRSETC